MIEFFFLNIGKFFEEKIDFTIVGGVYEEDKCICIRLVFLTTRILKMQNLIKEFNLYEVDWVIGHTMLINLKKFEQKKFFDENFFLFY